MYLPIHWKPLMKRNPLMMKRTYLAGISAVATATIAAAGVASGMIGSGSEVKRRMAEPPGAPAFASPAAPDDPNKAAERDFFERYNAWLDSPAAQSLDVRTLPRAFLMAEFLPSQRNLDAAIARADVIALVEAMEYKFGSWGSSVTLKVESLLKGPSATTLTVSLPGGPQPRNLEFTEAKLVEGEAAPILLPGDRAVLFLERSRDGERLNAEPYSGHYRVDASNKIQALPGNSFRRDVDAMNVDDFMRTVRERMNAAR